VGRGPGEKAIGIGDRDDLAVALLAVVGCPAERTVFWQAYREARVSATSPRRQCGTGFSRTGSGAVASREESRAARRFRRLHAQPAHAWQTRVLYGA